MQEMPHHSPHRVLDTPGGRYVPTTMPCCRFFDTLGFGWGQDLVTSDSLVTAAVFNMKFLVFWRINKIKKELCSFEAQS